MQHWDSRFSHGSDLSNLDGSSTGWWTDASIGEVFAQTCNSPQMSMFAETGVECRNSSSDPTSYQRVELDEPIEKTQCSTE